MNGSLVPRTLRGRMLAIVLGVAVVPLVLLGGWLAGATARSGEALLRERLSAALDDAAYRMGIAWVQRRSELLDLADTESVRAAALAGDTVVPEIARAWLAEHDDITRLELRRAGGPVLWSVVRESSAADLPGVEGAVPVRDGIFGPHTGDLAAHIDVEPLIGAASAVVPGMVLAAFEPRSSTPLSSLPFDPLLLRHERFQLGHDEWLTTRRRLSEPAVELATAAALTPYVAPFQAAARGGLVVLAAVSAVALVLVLVLTRRQTRSLEQLAAAADAVRRGEWEGRVERPGTDEVARVASAFNNMTESLRRTMADLADRRAFAAVGEFAASLAHEIRNPLTSIQVDLQMVEERLPSDDLAGRDIQARALAEIRRLDATLAGALQTARSGRMTLATVDLCHVLNSAAEASRSVFETRRAQLEITHVDDSPVLTRGEREALVQMTLNLLLNASQAVSEGGRVSARCEARSDANAIIVEDDGPGIPAADLERVFEPLYTTREGGTGLGLAIARRLARAHGGDVTLENAPAGGTRAVVTLPTASDEALQTLSRS